MAMYFYTVNDKKNGPFTFEQLKQENLQRTTLVWRDGLTNWISAENLEEFKEYFKEVPPTIPLSKEKLLNKKIATEVISIEKTLGYSTVVGVVILIICLFVFNPFKFDGEKFSKLETINAGYSGNINTGVSYPAWWDEGFYDYTDGKVGFICTNPKRCYDERESYLMTKGIKYGFFGFLISFVVLLLYRYSTKSQKWVNENAT